VGDVASRPAASIAARFGADAVAVLRRLLGDEDGPTDPLAHPEPLHFERRFPEPVALQASVAACFLDLLREGVVALEQRDLGGRRFALTLFRSDGARHRLAIEPACPRAIPRW
jgi:protein ImuB